MLLLEVVVDEQLLDATLVLLVGLADVFAGGAPRDLADGRDLDQRQPRLNYALAHLACDYLASTQGEDVLWDLALQPPVHALPSTHPDARHSP